MRDKAHTDDVAAMLRNGAPIATVASRDGHENLSVGGLLVDGDTYALAAAVAFNGEGPPRPRRIGVIETWTEADLGKD